MRSGDAVRARLESTPGHTRLPAYVRGHRGIVTDCHGGFPLDDALARGETVVEALYTVRFEIGTLFPERAGSPDRVHVELWESHVEDA